MRFMCSSSNHQAWKPAQAPNAMVLSFGSRNQTNVLTWERWKLYHAQLCHRHNFVTHTHNSFTHTHADTDTDTHTQTHTHTFLPHRTMAQTHAHNSFTHNCFTHNFATLTHNFVTCNSLHTSFLTHNTVTHTHAHAILSETDTHTHTYTQQCHRPSTCLLRGRRDHTARGWLWWCAWVWTLTYLLRQAWWYGHAQYTSVDCFLPNS